MSKNHTEEVNLQSNLNYGYEAFKDTHDKIKNHKAKTWCNANPVQDKPWKHEATGFHIKNQEGAEDNFNAE